MQSVICGIDFVAIRLETPLAAGEKVAAKETNFYF